MKGLFIFAVLAAGAASLAGAACYSSDCKLGCCRQSGMDRPCYCSACCIGESDKWKDDRAQVYVDHDRIAAVYRFRVEFYRGRNLRPAVTGSGGKARPLRAPDSGWGRLSFVDASGRPVKAKPRAVRRFKEGIYPIAPRSVMRPSFLACTDPQWGVSKDSSAREGFCGALSVEGGEVFRLTEAEDPGVAREPIGLSDDAQEALFALTKTRDDGGREIVGYRVWRKGVDSEKLPADSPRVKPLVEKYEGRQVLPSLETGTPTP